MIRYWGILQNLTSCHCQRRTLLTQRRFFFQSAPLYPSPPPPPANLKKACTPKSKLQYRVQFMMIFSIPDMYNDKKLFFCYSTYNKEKYYTRKHLNISMHLNVILIGWKTLHQSRWRFAQGIYDNNFITY